MKALSDRCRILIVDPFYKEGSPLEGVFDSRSTFDVVWAADARSAAQTIESGGISVVISEFCLPDATAAQLCKNLNRSSPIHKFFIYNALGRDIDRRESIESGAAGFFVVPDEISLIEAAVTACFAELHFESAFTTTANAAFRTDSRPFRRSRQLLRRRGGII